MLSVLKPLDAVAPQGAVVSIASLAGAIEATILWDYPGIFAILSIADHSGELADLEAHVMRHFRTAWAPKSGRLQVHATVVRFGLEGNDILIRVEVA